MSRLDITKYLIEQGSMPERQSGGNFGWHMAHLSLQPEDPGYFDKDGAYHSKEPELIEVKTGYGRKRMPKKK